MNDRTYEEVHNFNIPQDNIEAGNEITDAFMNTNANALNDTSLSVGIDNISNRHISKNQDKVTFADLSQASADLIRYVVNDKKKSQIVLSTLLQWTKYFKNGSDISIRFHKDTTDNVENNIPQQTNVDLLGKESGLMSDPKYSDATHIQRAIASGSNVGRQTVRKKSRLEMSHLTKRKREVQLKTILTGNNSKNNDRGILGKPRVRSYGCCICHKTGHRYTCCPEIIDHGTPLDLKNKEVRILLCQRLNSTNQLIANRESNDKRIVMISVPKTVIGVIIHKSYWIESRSSEIKDVSNICLECTFLKDFGRMI